MIAAAFPGTARFESVRLVGSGGMGQVYEAIDRQTGARVALKRLHATSAQALLHVRREFRSLESLRHDNLVSLFELVEDGGEVFFTMELVEGTDLLTYVGAAHRELGASGVTTTWAGSAPASAPVPPRANARRAEPIADITRLRGALAQLATALAVLHAAGRVHRDVKPSNILVTPAGRLVLLDFGLAIEVREQSADDLSQGTRAFMAPEQAAGDRVGPPADLYAMGVVLFVALTSELPVRGAEMERRRAQGVPAVRSVCPEAPADLATLCDELLAVDPAERPTAADVLRWLGVKPQVESRPHDAPGGFVGRHDERAFLHEQVTASRAGARVAVVVGDSGVGKTALVQELIEEVRARQPSALILSSRCREREWLAYKAFDGIVEGLSAFLLDLDEAARQKFIPQDAALLARIFPLLARVPQFAHWVDASAPLTPLQQRTLGFAALRHMLATIAADRVVVLFVDDLQWADADSVVLLADLFGVAEAPPVAVIATSRPRAEGTPDVVTDVAVRLGDVLRRVPLGPLPDDDARDLVRRALGSTVDDAVASSITREGAGHPLFLLTLTDHATGPQRGATTTRLDDALWSRVERVDARARGVLELVALAGEPVSASVGVAATGLDPARYAATTDALRVARLTRTISGGAGVEPYHDRIRETLVARLDEPRRRECHARLASALELTGHGESHPESLVRHLAGAGEPARAAHHAERAARRATKKLAFDQAAELFRTALELDPRQDEQWRQPLRVELAETLASAGRGTDAAEAYLACAHAATAEQRIDLQQRAADHLLRSGHVDRGLRVLSDVLAEHGEALPRSTVAALFRMAWPRLLPRVRHLRYQQRPAHELPAEKLRRFDVYHAVSVSLCLMDTARGGAFQSRSVALALELGEPVRLGRALALDACYVGSTSTSGLARARRILEELRRLAASTGDPYLAACAIMVDGFLDHHGASFRGAQAKFVEAERAFRGVPGSYFEGGFCLWFRLVGLRNFGQWAEISRGFEEWLRDAGRRGDLFNETSIRINLNAVWLVRDDVESARRDLQRTTWAPPAVGFHLQHWYIEWARVEIALYSGQARALLDDFRTVYRCVSRTFIPRIRIQRAMLHWAYGRVLVAAGRPDEASRFASKLGGEDMGYARVWSLLLAAAVAHQKGHRSTAVRALRESITMAEANDLPQCASAARLRLGTMVGGDEGDALHRVAIQWATEQGIVRLDRMAEVWAPGFGAARAHGARVIRLPR